MAKTHPDPPIASKAAPWRELVVVCRKCGKKIDGGFGHKRRESLPRVLKALLRARGEQRRVRIVEGGCLGVCPKKAVTVASGSLPGRMLVVPRGTDPALLAGELLGELRGEVVGERAAGAQPDTRSILAPQPDSLRSTAS